MEAWVWSHSFLTGMSKVDQEHQRLVDLINELGRALFSAATPQPGTLEASFERLVDHTRFHFQEEEQLMQELHVDGRHIELHCSVHQQFIAQLQALWDRRQHTARPKDTLMGFLTSWLGLHIFGIDMALSRQICLIENGVEPTRAFEREASAHDNEMNSVLKLAGNLYQVLSEQNLELAQINQVLESRLSHQSAQLAAGCEQVGPKE